MTLRGRDETTEGIDKKLAVDYYSRWTFVHDLMPLLRKAKDAGEDAKYMSVLAAGEGGVIDLDNLGLKNGYSLPSVVVAAATYNDLMIEVSFPTLSLLEPSLMISSSHTLRNSLT